ncbi:FHA domain- TPR-repeat-containing protein [Salinisphaera sp. PC39]|uniref:FHA domain-containing protein n=1 Tax=Salinisphaera sp. PC39 TaxID=1304156 RepID=UPI00333EBEC6
MSGFQIFDTTNSIEHELPDGKTVVGRGADSDIRLLSSSVSRKHGMFEVRDGALFFSDLGSSNGSFVNDQQVKAEVQLRPGDSLLLGDFQFTVKHADADAAEAGGDDEATQLAAPGGGGGDEIPSVWSENVGLENASGTQFFAEPEESDAVNAYREGRLDIPSLGDTPRLVVLTGDNRGTVFTLESDPADTTERTWKIGRESGSVDLVIPDASVSGQHAQLVNEGARWKIVNWMSTNGTFVNGHKGLSTYLKGGDVIRMGSAELAFELPPGWGRDAAGDAGRDRQSAKADGAFARLGAMLKRLFGGG